MREDLKADIGLAAAEVGRLVKEETEHTKRVEAFGPTIAKTMGSVEDKSLQIAGYTGRSGGVKAKNEQAFEKSCEAMSSAFAASLTAEYKRAWLEGRRELHCNEIVAGQAELKEKFDEEVEVDLAHALLKLDGTEEERSERHRKAIASMNKVGGVLKSAAPVRPPPAEGEEEGAEGSAPEGAPAGEEAGPKNRWKFHQKEKVRRAAAAEAAAAREAADRAAVMASEVEARREEMGEAAAAAAARAALEAAAAAEVAARAAEAEATMLAEHPERQFTPSRLHSGRGSMRVTTPEGASVPGMWPRPRSRATPLKDETSGSLSPRPRSRAKWDIPSSPDGTESVHSGFGSVHAPRRASGELGYPAEDGDALGEFPPSPRGRSRPSTRGEVDDDPRPITPYRLSLSRPISSGADVPQTVPEASEVSPIQEPESEEPMVVDAEAAAEAEKWRRCGHPTASSPTPSAKGSMFEAKGAGGGSRIVPEQPLPGGRTAFQPSGLSNNPFALAKADAPLPQKDIRKGGPSAPSVGWGVSAGRPVTPRT